MADDKSKEDINKKEQESINESALKQTINSVSLDGLDSLLPQKETGNTKKSKDDTTSSLSGIDDISSYIQKQKEKSDRISPELLTARDGTDLLSQEGVYAIVPHKKNDHKIVYTRQNAPKDLLDDPKQRKKGTEYKKNSMKIYDVHVDYAEHPTLMSADGQPLDVWIIDDPKDLEDQLQAIRDGKGGGTNFMSPVLAKTNQDLTQKSDKNKSSLTNKETKDHDKKKTTKKPTSSQKKESESLKSLDDILPVSGEKKDTTNENKNTTNEQTVAQKKQSALSLDDILPVESKTEDENTDSDTLPVKEKKPKNLASLDDILPKESKKEIEDESEVPTPILEKKEKKQFSLDDILPKKEEEDDKKTNETQNVSEEIIEVPESDSDNSETIIEETNNSIQDNDENTKDLLDESEKDDSTIEIEETEHNETDHEEIEIIHTDTPVPEESKQKDEVAFELPQESSKDEKEILELGDKTEEEEEEIELPSLESFIPKDINNESPEVIVQEDIEEEKEESIEGEKTEDVDISTSTTDWSEGFSADELLPTDPSTEKEVQIEPTLTPEVEMNQTQQGIESKETIREIPNETSEVVISEKVQETPQEEAPDDLIDLDDMTFEPIAQNDVTQTQATSVYNDGIIGNEDEDTSTSSKGNIGLLILKIAVAIILLGIAGYIVFIMVGGSNTTPNEPQDNPPEQEQQEAPQDDTDTQEPPEELPSQPSQPTPIVPQPEPIDPPDSEPVINQPVVEQTFTLPQLLAKLQAQQSEARRLLNKAKLLNSREGIKFATAGFIKSSKSLDEASQDPTITADELQRDAQRIDLYLGQAQSIIEGE